MLSWCLALDYEDQNFQQHLQQFVDRYMASLAENQLQPIEDTGMQSVLETL